MRHLFQRLPLPVPPWPRRSGARRPSPTGRARSARRRSSRPTGCSATIQSRATMRVSAWASTRSLWTLKTRPCSDQERADERGDRERQARLAIHVAAAIAPTPPAGRGSGRSAAASGRRSATGCRGRGPAGAARARAAAEPAMAGEQRDGAAEREQRRQPAQAPGEGRQVVAPARRVGQAELAAVVARGLGLLLQPLAEGLVVEQRVRVGGDEARAHQPDREPRLRTRACATGDANAAAIIVTSTIPAVYLVAIATPSAEAREHVFARAAGAVDPGDADQRGGQRRQRRRVVEREVAVVDRQERDRQQRAGEQRRCGGRRTAARRRSRSARRRARRGRPMRRGRARTRSSGSAAKAPPTVAGIRPPAHREERVDDVRERRRVDEVVRVQAVPEHPDRPRHEVAVLVRVVDVRQAGLEPDQAQASATANSADDHRRPRPPPR